MTLVLSVLEQGMIYAIMALGIYITYTILDFPDLTVDGSFPLGAAISAVLITKGVNPILTLLISFLAGVAAGTLTGLIHVKLKVRDLLSGIIMMTALYTVNLRIAGRANVPIYNMTMLFDNALVKKIFTIACTICKYDYHSGDYADYEVFTGLVYEHQIRLSAAGSRR